MQITFGSFDNIKHLLDVDVVFENTGVMFQPGRPKKWRRVRKTWETM